MFASGSHASSFVLLLSFFHPFFTLSVLFHFRHFRPTSSQILFARLGSAVSVSVRSSFCRCEILPDDGWNRRHSRNETAALRVCVCVLVLPYVRARVCQ